MKVGARNRITGKVTEINKGKIMCFVKLDIPAKSKMGSVMTLESLKELGIKKGDEVEVIVKAVNVLLIKRREVPARRLSNHSEQASDSRPVVEN